jgi:nucleotide-binding universal stress UspA family protein
MFDKIMVCLDGSELAEQILPFAIEQSSHFNSQVILCRIIPSPSLTGIGIPGFPAMPIETTSGAKQAAKNEMESISYLKGLANRILTEHGLKSDCVAIFGNPGESIVKYATENKVDLIAIATHGRSGLYRTMIGSVADYVIRQSGIPILLIRPK